MIKTKEISDPNSCLNKARDDEPLFVLRAHDPRASSIVRAWATDYRYVKGGARAMTSAQAAKFAEACAIADAMDAWKATLPKEEGNYE